MEPASEETAYSSPPPTRGMAFIGRYSVELSVLLLVASIFLTNQGFFGSAHHLEWADAASNALQIQRASEWKETLGPYSRYHFHHPGPANFYYLALGELLWQSLPTHLARFHAMQLLVNGLWLLALAWLGRRIRGRASDAGILVGSILFTMTTVRGENWDPLISIWGPDLVILPMTVFVVAVSFLARGDIRPAALAAAAAVVAVQSHLATGALILPLVLIAMGLHLWAVRQKQARDRAWWFCVGSAVAILFLANLPPLYEELQPGEGNISEVLRFFSERSTSHTLGEILASIGRAWTRPLQVHMGMLFGDQDPEGLPFQLVVILLLGTGSVLLVRRSSAGQRWLTASVWGALFFAFLSGRGVVGPVFPFLFRYTFGLSGLLYGLLLLGLAQELEHRRPNWRLRVGPCVAGLLLVGGLAYGVSKPLPIPEHDDSVEKILAVLPPSADSAPVQIDLEFEGPHHYIWPKLAGLVLHLGRSGYDVFVRPDWGAVLAASSHCEPSAARHVLALRRPGAREGAWQSLDLRGFSSAYRWCEDEGAARDFLRRFSIEGLPALHLDRNYDARSRALRFEGWKEPRSGFRPAARDSIPRIYFFAPDLASVGTPRLHIELAGSERGRVQIHLNDFALGEREIENSAPSSMTLDPPVEALHAGGSNVLSFSYDSNSPAIEARKPGAELRFVSLKLALQN